MGFHLLEIKRNFNDKILIQLILSHLIPKWNVDAKQIVHDRRNYEFQSRTLHHETQKEVLDGAADVQASCLIHSTGEVLGEMLMTHSTDCSIIECIVLRGKRKGRRVARLIGVLCSPESLSIAFLLWPKIGILTGGPC